MNLQPSFTELFGNELLFVFSFIGTVVFLILAWISTRVNWEIWPVQTSGLRYSPDQEPTVSDLVQLSNLETNRNNENETNLTEDIFAFDSSDSCVEDTPDLDNIARKRNTKKTLHSSTSRSSLSSQTGENLIADDQGVVDAPSKDYLKLKLQYLDGQTKIVYSSPTTSIRRFKRKYFADELIKRHKNVRLIYQGRELTELYRNQPNSSDGKTVKIPRLTDYGVNDDSTIHCLITNRVISSPDNGRIHSDRENTRPTYGFSSTSNESVLTEFDMGTRLMKPLFAFLLLFTWFFRIVYRQYFNSLSTFALVALTVFYCGPVFAVTFVNFFSLITSSFSLSIPNNNNNNNNENDNNNSDNVEENSDIGVSNELNLNNQELTSTVSTEISEENNNCMEENGGC